MKGLVSGSFDPITLGHLNVINKAAGAADELIVCVFINEDKQPFLDLSTRRELISAALNGRENILADSSTGTVADYCKNNGIDVIFRGFRNHEDYAYEAAMAKYNYERCGILTRLIPADVSQISLSSSEVRERIRNSKDLVELLPYAVIERLKILKES